MADLAEADEPADGFDHVVRSLSARLVDHEYSVNLRGCGVRGMKGVVLRG